MSISPLTLLSISAEKSPSLVSTDSDSRQRVVYYVTTRNYFTLQFQSYYGLPGSVVSVTLLYDKYDRDEVQTLDGKKPLIVKKITFDSEFVFTVECKIGVLSSKHSDMMFLLHVKQRYNDAVIAEMVVGSFQSFSKNDALVFKDTSPATTKTKRKTKSTEHVKTEPFENELYMRKLDEIKELQKQILQSVNVPPQQPQMQPPPPVNNGNHFFQELSDPVEELKNAILMLSNAYERLGDNRGNILREIVADDEISSASDFLGEISHYISQTPKQNQSTEYPGFLTEPNYLQDPEYYPEDYNIAGYYYSDDYFDSNRFN